MLKKLCVWLTILFLGLSLAGCGVTSSSAGERRVVDGAGREVRLPLHPSRIVSLTYGTDEILAELVSFERILAFCKYAGNEDITFITASECEQVGRVSDGEAEQLLALKPDLVLASTSTPQQVVQLLASSGVPVYVSEIPSTYEGMKGKIHGVAEAVNEKEQGEALILLMDDKLAVIEEKLSSITPEKERTALGLSFRGILGKKGSLFADVLRLAHVRDGAATYDLPKGTNTYLSLEVLPKINPDVIFLPVWHVREEDDPQKFADQLLTNPAFGEIKAVKEGRLIPFSEKYKYVMSHHVVDAIEAAARVVYPEIF